ncbi:MAG: lysozyme inhibitor LprI family protein [Pseudomonadota bacterium]
MRFHQITKTIVSSALALIFAAGFSAAPPTGSDETELPSVGMAEVIEGCMISTAAGDKPLYECIGIHSRHCLTFQDNQTTAGMEKCYLDEYRGWDVLLNRYYNENGQRQVSAQFRDVQRSWISYRDKKCAYFRIHYEGGSMARWLGARCMMDETARRTIDLRFFEVDR